MKLRYKVIFSCLLIFSCFIFIHADNSQKYLDIVKTEIRKLERYDSKKDFALWGSPSLLKYQGKRYYSFSYLQGDYSYSEANGGRWNKYILQNYLVYDDGTVEKRTYNSFDSSSSNMGFDVKNGEIVFREDLNTKLYNSRIIVDVYENGVKKKLSLDVAGHWLIRLMKISVMNLVAVILEIVKMAIIPLVGVICLIGSVRYFKRLSRYLLKL